VAEEVLIPTTSKVRERGQAGRKGTARVLIPFYFFKNKNEICKDGGLRRQIKMKKLVYIAGPYRGDIKKNIENAEKKSIELIRRGFDVLTPHKNSAGYEQYEDEIITHRTWLDLGLNLLSRCDVLYVMKNAEKSEGTQAEIAFALKHNIVVVRE